MLHLCGESSASGLFNILGPLTNPAGAKNQLLGVFQPNLTRILRTRCFSDWIVAGLWWFMANGWMGWMRSPFRVKHA
jgi:hypothetical protein